MNFGNREIAFALFFSNRLIYIQIQISFRLLFLSILDTYDIFIDSGGSPDIYLTPEINSFLNDSLFNATFDSTNSSIFTHQNINDNATISTGDGATDDDVAELVIMAVTSIVLGLMILITVIG